jgi:hypothetical protein
MKGTLLRFFSAVIIVVLVISVIYSDLYAQRLAMEDTKEKSAKQQEEKLAAVEANKKKEIQEEQERLLLRQHEEEQLQKATYTLAAVNSQKSLFTNKVDGYTIEVPGDMKADMSFSNIRAVLEDRDLKIEIYRQDVGNATGASIISYINYSNQFINNNIDHYKELEGKIKLDGRSVSYLQWSRRPLARIENDKCYYASVEVPLSGKEVITFFFKSSREFENKDYMDVVRSMKIVDKTAKPYIQKIHKTNNTSWDTQTADVYERYFGDNTRLHWGIFETDAPVNFTELKKIETKLDFTFPILLYYTGILEYKDMHPNLELALENAKKEGRILELTLQTVAQSPGKGNMVYDVLDGQYDTYLKNYARAVVNSGAPVLFRLGNEMNGDWCVYSSHHTSKDTDIFKAFYLYVYQIFEEAGAHNVIWVWNPNGKPFPDFKWNDELCYYPGDNYVDVVGMTSYNTGTYYESETWMEFDQMYDSLYRKYAEQYEKPLMITEFSSSSVGGSKEEWVANMFRNIYKYDRIKVAVWWDGCDWDAEGNVARSYFIDETDELVRIFRENLARFK